MKKNDILREVLLIIRKYLDDDYRVYLFGSWPKGEAYDTSDIDVGILGKEKVPWDIMVRISEEVGSIATLRKIDVLDFNSVEERFKKSALAGALELNQELPEFSPVR